MQTLINPCPTVTPGDIQGYLSNAAQRTAFRYLGLSQEHPDDDAIILAMSTFSLGAATLAKHLNEAAGLEPSVGCQMLSRVADELRVLSQAPGDHSQALTALGVELVNMAIKEESSSYD